MHDVNGKAFADGWLVEIIDWEMGGVPIHRGRVSKIGDWGVISVQLNDGTIVQAGTSHIRRIPIGGHHIKADQ